MLKQFKAVQQMMRTLTKGGKGKRPRFSMPELPGS
jgi:hypothetical protein